MHRSKRYPGAAIIYSISSSTRSWSPTRNFDPTFVPGLSAEARKAR
jgi:hypothetical protein